MSKEDIIDGNYQHIRGASEESIHDPQFTLNHLRVFLWSPYWKFSQSDMPLTSWYTLSIVYQEALALLHLDFCLLVVFVVVAPSTLIKVIPAEVCQTGVP